MQLGLYIIEDNHVVCAGEENGAILMEDELWHPFRYFGNGKKEIHEEAFFKPSTARKMAKMIYS